MLMQSVLSFSLAKALSVALKHFDLLVLCPQELQVEAFLGVDTAAEKLSPATVLLSLLVYSLRAMNSTTSAVVLSVFSLPSKSAKIT